MKEYKSLYHINEDRITNRKIHSTNYRNTFIAIAEDSPTVKTEIPPSKEAKITVANTHST